MQPFNYIVDVLETDAEKYKSINLLFSAIIMVFALVLTLPINNTWAESEEFSEAEIFFELNNTDGDLGIHSSIDGEPYDLLQVFDPDDNIILNMKAKNSLGNQGQTQFFFESAEPPFDELDPADFFNRFPDGDYIIKAKKIDGGQLRSITEITHILPAPVSGIMVDGVTDSSVLTKEHCDDEDAAYDPIEIEGGEVTISWDEVTMSHPDASGPGAGQQPPVPVIIHNYEVIVETTIDLGGGEEFDTIFNVILPPDVTSIVVPEAFISQSDEFKYEILAREESFNQTAIESCFVIAED